MTESTEVNDHSAHVYLPLLLVPNLIGYFRIILLIGFVFTALSYPIITFILYFISGNLDAIDGFCARKLNQESKVGRILDYAIDRASVTAALIVLSLLYRHQWAFFCFLLMLDIFSHICQLYSTVFSQLNSHKLVGKQQGVLLSLYYTNRKILYFTCASHDLLLACWYLYHFYPKPSLLYVSLLFIPGFIFKVMIHLLQIISVFKNVCAWDSVDAFKT